MPIIESLASSLGRRDEVPNVELAARLSERGDSAAVAELAALLFHKKADVSGDAVKVLYEIGARRPELVAPHATALFDLLKSKVNRLVWGAMTGLDAVAAAAPQVVFERLGEVMSAAERGSIIAKDRAVWIFTKLAVNPDYRGDVMPLLFELMGKAADGQFPSYCEMALPVVGAGERTEFAAMLRGRLADLPKESQRKRVEKVLKKLG